MPYFEFIWTNEIIKHIAEHGLTPDDFECVVTDPELQVTSHSSGRPAAWGRIADGRLVLAIYELIDEVTVLPVTAYEIEESSDQ